MCGLGGVLVVHEPGDSVPPHEEAIPERWLDSIDDSIKHRGPDGAGRFRDRAACADGSVVDVALVHRRLSIIDHAGGHQPMVHLRNGSSGTGLWPLKVEEDTVETPVPLAEDAPDLVVLVFNGCIYNHRELRAELEAGGHAFETDHSDTEVLIHGWRAWGVDMQEKLDGMYTFLIWDRRTARLAWGRDLAGEKPLYIRREGGVAIIASSPAAMLENDRLQRDPPPEHIEAWIAKGCAHTPPIATLREVRPGTTSIDPAPRDQAAHESNSGEHTSSARRKSLDATRCASPPSERVTFCPLLEHAVTSRLEADVPLGVFLSGGIDSALIAAIARKARPDIKAFTVRMPDARYDESQDAAETAEAIGIEHVILACEPDPAGDLVRLIEQLGLPFGDSSLLPTYWVSKAAREHVKVALSGDGGDELFGGYRRHAINPFLRCWRHVLGLVPDRLLGRREPGSQAASLARLAVAARHAGYEELRSIFPTPDLRRLLPGHRDIVERSGFQRVPDPLRDDFLHYLPDDLLRKTDTASMAVALEVRSPFFARDLIEAALRTPLDVLMPGGERKGLLKQVARRYLPGRVVDRPKRGFAIPIGSWFRTDYGGMRTLLLDHLTSDDPFPGLDNAGVHINRSFVHQMLREHDAAGEASRSNPWHGRDHSQRLYMLLVLSIWSRWLDRSGKEAEFAAESGA